MCKILIVLLFAAMCTPLYAQESEGGCPAPSKFRNNFAVKTNALALAGTVANAGVEIAFDDCLSLDLPVYYSPYNLAPDKKLRVLSLRPSVRYWLRGSRSGGWFVGIGSQITWFNVATGGSLRYQDNRPILGLGLTGGYAWYFSGHFGMEAVLGAGYASISYDTFENVPDGPYIGSYKRDYWGLTEASVSLVYRF